MWSLSKRTGKLFKNGIVPEGADRRALPRLLKAPLAFADRLALAGWMPGKAMFSATAICLVLVVGGTFFSNSESANWALASMTSKMGFKIREIRINGTREIRREHVRAELKVGDDTSIVTYDVHAAWERLYDLAWVGKVAITKIYPDTLAVEITERKPFAVWQQAGKLKVIERNGDIIVPFQSKFADLPVVVGKYANQKAAQLVDMVNRYPGIVKKAKAFVLIGERRWDVHLKNGVTVMLPEVEPEMALARFSQLEREKKLSEREINVVDLRLPGQMVLRLSENGMRHREAKAGKNKLVGGSI